MINSNTHYSVMGSIQSDILGIIFEYLDTKNLILASRTCKKWRYTFKKYIGKYKLDLSLWSNKITNLEPLGNLVKLEKLVIADENVLDIEPISHLNKLKNLNIRKTPISDIDPLKELRGLDILNISNCPGITDEQVEELQKAFPRLWINR